MLARVLAVAVGIALFAAAHTAAAERKYGPGVTDTEIKIGQTMPYSGPASALSTSGRVQAAYFKMISAQGGVNGRKINLLSLDDALSAPKTVEQTRKLVEGEEVLAIFGTMGSGPNIAIAKYLNGKKVPQILVTAGSSKLVDPKNLPWTTTFYMPLTMEAKAYAIYLLRAKPAAKIGVLYQNDESGKVYLEGLKAGLGDKAAAMVIKEVAFDLTDPTIDSQILSLKATGVDTVFLATTAPKFGAQGIRRIGEIGWKPQIVLVAGLSQVESTLKPAGLENAVGAITSVFLKMPADPQWEGDAAMQEYYKFMKEWAPGEPAGEAQSVSGYLGAQMLVEVLKRCGDDLTRENVLYQATHISDLQLPMFVPGIKINITPEDRVPWKHARMARFDGTSWVFIGDVIATTDEH